MNNKTNSKKVADKTTNLFKAGVVESVVKVEEILNRKQEPTVEEISISDKTDFLSAVREQANQIHRKSIRGPAHLLVVSEKGFNAHVSKLNEFKPTPLCSSNIKFEDAKWAGYLDNRYSVFVSKKLPADKVLLGREGEGLRYEMDPDSDVPHVNIYISKESHMQPGQVAFWCYINL